MYHSQAKGLIVLVLLIPIIVFGQNPGRRYNHKGLILLKNKKYLLAEISFKKAIYYNPHKSSYYNNRAVALIKLKRYKEAQEMIDMALKIDPRNLKALSNLASLFYYKKEYKKAYNVCIKLYDMDPNFISKRFPHKKVLKRLKARSQKEPGNSFLKKIIFYLEKY